MRRSSYLKLSRIITFTVAIGIWPMRNASARPMNGPAASVQAQSESSEELDTTLAKFYDLYFNLGTFENRIQQATAATGVKPKQLEIVKSREEKSHMGVASSQLPPGRTPQVWGEVMNSDLIVVGTPVKDRALPNENRTFAFTEYAVQVEKVLVPDHNNVLPGDTIIVSRGGGELTVDNVLIKAIEPAFSEFLLHQSYIFMLRSVPGTTTYQALASGTFAVRNGEVSSVSNFEKGATPKKELSSFISDIDSAIERKRQLQKNKLKIPHIVMALDGHGMFSLSGRAAS